MPLPAPVPAVEADIAAASFRYIRAIRVAVVYVVMSYGPAGTGIDDSGPASVNVVINIEIRDCNPSGVTGVIDRRVGGHGVVSGRPSPTQ